MLSVLDICSHKRTRTQSRIGVHSQSGAVRSTLAVALAACLSSSRMKLRAATLLPAQLPLSMCAIDACGGALSSCIQSSQSLLSPFLLLVSRAFFAASSLAALHALHPQNALLVAGPLTPRLFSPSSMRLCCVPCGTPTCCLTLAPRIVLVVTLLHPMSSKIARLSFPPPVSYTHMTLPTT